MDNKNNTGKENSGRSNSGDRNSGRSNSGNGNSGDGNSGNGNSGNGNSGDGNSGDGNSGSWNFGYGNSTDRDSGIFNSKKGTVRLFNKRSGLTYDEIDHPHFGEFYLNKWIPEDDMTDEEKEENPSFHVSNGYLKTFTYKEAWKNFWRETDDKNKQKFLDLPNFDAEIFKDITGIDVEQTEDKKKLLDKAQELIDKAEELKKEAGNL